MDPDETLKQIRQLVTRPASNYADDDFDTLARYVEALDNWLSTGGFLPSDWAKNRSSK